MQLVLTRPSWYGWVLRTHNIDANAIAGLIPFSGHTITYFTVREEKGIEGTKAIFGDLAPLYYVRNDAPTLLLIIY